MSNSSRNILLLVTGMTPQIITETVYGLAVQPAAEERWIPDEIHVISTQDGLIQIRSRLFEKGNFQRLIDDYQLPPIDFDESKLHCIEQNGQRLKDLKTPDDNEQAADTICALVRRFTADDHTRVHVSIAGGRKTMGFYAGYALSLYGRAQDSMSHVLVEDRFETVGDFYYPTPNTHYVTNREGKELDASEAQVWLANIPFVRLRGSLPKSSLLSEAKFSDVVRSINLANHPQVVVNVAEKKVSVGSLNCVLAAREFAFYWWFAASRVQGEGTIVAPNKEITANANTKDEYPELIELADAYLNYYTRLKKDDMSSDAVQHTLRNGMERSFFDERMTSIKKKFKQAFGADVTAQIEIANHNRVGSHAKKQPSASASSKKDRPVGVYKLRLDADQVVIHE